MRGRWISLVLLLGFAAAGAGCASVRNSFFQRHFVDSPDPTDSKAETWVSDAGKEARGDRTREKDPDGFWLKHIYSEKHRSIERNLGVDY